MITELNNVGAIAELLESLHDCPFDLDQARLDRRGQEWLGRFLRPIWDAPEAQHRRRGLVIWESRLPVVEVRLRLREVTNIRIIDDQGIGQYSFNSVDRISDGLRLDFNERMKIEVKFGGEPTGSYEEVPLADIRAVYRQWLIVQTGPTLQIAPGASSSWAV